MLSNTGGVKLLDDSVPTSGTPVPNPWNWTSVTKHSGSYAHTEYNASGLHEHYYTGGKDFYIAGLSDIGTWIYQSGNTPPSEIMLSWRVGSSWEHRAYWGTNSINRGTNGTDSRRYMGARPSIGSWQQLVAPASQVGLEGQYVNGAAFTLYNGYASFDEVTNWRRAYYLQKESTATAEYKPSLSVTYWMQVGLDDYRTYQDFGPLKVDLFSGNLVYSQKDVDVAGRGIDTEITHVHNSRADTDSPYGYNWSLEPTMKLTEQANGDVAIVEGDGSRHIWGKSGTDYVHPAGIFRTLVKNSTESTYSLCDIHSHVTWYFASSGLVTDVVDQNNNRSTYSYTSGKLSKIRDASGRDTTLTYDGNGRLASIVDPAYRTTTFGYSGSDLASITNAESETVSFLYDASHRLTRVTEPEGGRHLVFYYPVTGQVQFVEGPDEIENDCWEFSYDSTSPMQNLYTGVENGRGYGTGYWFNETGLLTKTRDSIGATADPETTETAFPNDEAVEASAIAAYDSYYAGMVAQGKLTAGEQAVNTRVPVATGRDTLFEYDANYNITKQTDKDLRWTSNTYDANGNVLTETDKTGLVTSHEYDSRNNETNITSPSGGVTVREYDTVTNNLLWETDANGNKTRYHYDQFGNVDWEVSPRGNAVGADPEKFKTKRFHDASGNYCTREEGPIVHNSDETTTQAIQVSTYNGVGEKLSSVDASGNTTYSVYDSVGRLQYTRSPGNVDGSSTVTYLRETKAYDDNGNVIKEEQIDESTGQVKSRTESVFDLADRLSEKKTWTDVDDPASVSQSTYAYDGCGNKTEEVNALGGTTTYEYDALNRITKTTQPDGTFVATKYDAIGNELKQGTSAGTTVKLYGKGGSEVASADESGHTIKLIADPDDNQTARADAASVTTDLNYDENGNLIGVAEPTATASEATGTLTEYQYDENDNNIAITYDADGQNPTGTNTTYNEEDEELGETDQEGNADENDYGPEMNLRSVRQANSTGFSVNYTAASQAAAVSAAGTVTAGSSNITARYDAVGNVIYTEARDAQTAALEATTSALYDDAARPTEMTGALGIKTAAAYDDAGSVVEVSDSKGGTSHAVLHDYDTASKLSTVTCGSTEIGLDYDTEGRRNEVTALGGDLRTDIGYGAASEVTSVVNRHEGAVLSSCNYAYDTKDNVAAVTETTATTSYQYDKRDRLVKVTNPGGSSVSYSYDTLGNRLMKANSAEGTTTYAYNDANEITSELRPGESLTYLHDANGNLTAMISNPNGTTTYAYDNNHRLVTATTPTSTVEFVYDGMGRRTKRAVTGAVSYSTYYVYDAAGNILSEIDDAGGVKVRYIRDDEGKALAMEQAGSTYFFLYNGRGDATGVTNASGNLVATYEYDEFGDTTAVTGTVYNPLRFSGGNNAYYDCELGLYWMTARHYDSRTGRWITRDDFRGFEYEPESLNRYVYAKNDPVGRIDPSGHAYLKFNGRSIAGFWNSGQQVLLWRWARTAPTQRPWLKKSGPIPPGNWFARETQWVWKPSEWAAWGYRRMPLYATWLPRGGWGRYGLFLHSGRRRGTTTGGCVRSSAYFVNMAAWLRSRSRWNGVWGHLGLKVRYGRRGQIGDFRGNRNRKMNGIPFHAWGYRRW